MVNGLSPPYLSNLLPSRVGNRSRYPLRTSDNFTVPICRTNIFLRSFLPATATEWNRLENYIKNAPTLSVFKARCKPKSQYRNSLFYYGPRWENVQLARMRIGCSNLKSHLCHNLHVEDNPSCNCGNPEETPKHFFLECPLYHEQRRNLYSVIDETSTSTYNILHGDDTTTRDENIMTLDAIYQYIRKTGRFKLQINEN